MAKKTTPASTTTTTPTKTCDYIEYAGRREYLRDFPQSTIATLCQRTANHMFQNESASKVKTARDKAAAEGNTLSESDENAIKAEFIAARWDAMLKGTLGESGARGPKRVGYEAHLHDVALALIEGKAREKALAEKVAVSAKMPKGEALKTLLEQAKSLPKVQAAARKKYEEEQALLEDDTTELDF